MARWALVSFAALVAIIAAFISLRPTSEAAPREVIYGRNNTVLIVADSHYGFANVRLATSFALLENHPEVEVHFASYSKLKPDVDRISKAGLARNLAAKPIQWHEIPGTDYIAATLRSLGTVDDIVGPPGLRGLDNFIRLMEWGIDPWSPEEHYALYQSIQEIILEVDPAVVVVDLMMHAGIEASRSLNRSSAFIAPNDLSSVLAAKQPRASLFWKYPAYVSPYLSKPFLELSGV